VTRFCWLGRESPIVGTEIELSAALKAWLAQFGDTEVCVDYSVDFELFTYLCRDPETLKILTWIKWRNINNEIDDRDIERYWVIHGPQKS